MQPITKRQAECKRIIARSISVNGYAPSILEIAEGLGKPGIGATHRLVKELEARGHIRRSPGQARAIEIIDAPASDLDAMSDDELRRHIAQATAILEARQ